MKRVAKKQRRISSPRAAQHLVWTSETHRKDRAAADRLRASVSVDLHPEQVLRKEIQGAEVLACQMIFEEDSLGEKETWTSQTKGKFPRFEEPEKFATSVAEVAAQRSWYTKGKADGNRKRKTPGIIDTYISIPPWWGRALNAAMKKGLYSVDQVRNALAQIATSAMGELTKRTGYEPIYISVHPESENNVHFHMGIANVDKDHKLVGRSASGKGGRKGLRHAGDCNLAIWRMYALEPNKVVEKPARKTLLGNYDDIAMAKVIDKGLGETFPQLKPWAEKAGVAHAKLWMQSAEERLQKKSWAEKALDENAQLKGENTQLKEENEAIKRKLQELEAVGPDV
jgi:hypothetical protein